MSATERKPLYRTPAATSTTGAESTSGDASALREDASPTGWSYRRVRTSSRMNVSARRGWRVSARRTRRGAATEGETLVRVLALAGAGARAAAALRLRSVRGWFSRASREGERREVRAARGCWAGAGRHVDDVVEGGERRGGRAAGRDVGVGRCRGYGAVFLGGRRDRLGAGLHVEAEPARLVRRAPANRAVARARAHARKGGRGRFSVHGDRARRCAGEEGDRRGFRATSLGRLDENFWLCC